MERFASVGLGEVGQGGYRALQLERDDHLGPRSLVGFQPLVSLVHLSDTHVCDAQSPARLTFSDRLGDPHHPLHDLVGGPVGNYRSNEMLTTQVFDSMVRTVNQLGRLPFSQREVDLVVITGDLTDNSQTNELGWVKSLVDGGVVSPNSGGKDYEGPGGISYSPYYWNPMGDTGGEIDFPKKLYGFPTIPELLPAVTESFSTPGFNPPHILVHGNHDLMPQGTVAANESLDQLARGDRRPEDFSDFSRVPDFVRSFSAIGPALWPAEEQMLFTSTTSDDSRKLLGNQGWLDELGLDRHRYFSMEVKGVLLIALDTVNEHGGWDGSISVSQYNWLNDTLREGQGLPAIILSHHPSTKLINTYAPFGAEPRVGQDRIKQALLSHKNVIAWLAGHDHQNRIQLIGGLGGFWHIETCSLIDWPQQGRLVDVFKGVNEYLIVTTMFDHQSPVRVTEKQRPLPEFDLNNNFHLASLSRELAANHWQRRGPLHNVSRFFGGPEDRNVFLSVRR
jgi:metallophosphoesterase (TIGR03767 family)